MRNDSVLEAAILVLMASLKNACDKKWFSEQDSNDIYTLQRQLLSSFRSDMNSITQLNNFQPIITIIMSRFYPSMRMGEILTFLEIKSGYQTYVHDFRISKDMNRAPEEKIRLFVARLDNIETSSCLITPAKANFLLNGQGVEKRTNVSMDTRHQMPTPVHSLLQYGINILQAVGDFKGRYIVVIAYMSMTSSTSDYSTLQDYVGPMLSMEDSEPFRISLHCPLSFTRIQVPVKGQMCDHQQCFDYESYMKVNSSVPYWKCPFCTKHLNFMDIRVDQNMVKVLNEVGENIDDVLIFSSDSSWKVIMGIEHSRHNVEDDDFWSSLYVGPTQESGSSSFLENSSVNRYLSVPPPVSRNAVEALPVQSPEGLTLQISRNHSHQQAVVGSFRPPRPPPPSLARIDNHQGSSSSGGPAMRRRSVQRAPQPPTVDPNWRPRGQMRGSLTGREYEEALQQAQARGGSHIRFQQTPPHHQG